MVGFKEKVQAGIEFDPAPLEKLQRPRSYSQLTKDGRKETWNETCDRTLYSPHLGLKLLGKFTDEEIALIDRYQRNKKAFGSARWLWVGGTPWIEKPENAGAAFNCTSFRLNTIDTFGMLMDLAMMGSGTGAVLELNCIDQLPPVVNELRVRVLGEFGKVPKDERLNTTICCYDGNFYHILVGDSRQGWVQAYQELINLATDKSAHSWDGAIYIEVDISNVRPSGERLKGFGGVANPIKLPDMFRNVAEVLNGAVGRKLNGLECCLLLGHAASAVVAGNIRRCLPETALVHTSKGLVRIKDIQIGDWVQTPAGFKRVVNKFHQGIQNVWEMDTNSIHFKATLNHKMAVMKDIHGGIEWKAVADLKEGDRLLHNREILMGVETSLPPDFTKSRPDNSRTAKSISIPCLTPEIAWLIGFTHGNGCVQIGKNKHNKPFGMVSWSANALTSGLADGLERKINECLSLFGLPPVARSTISGENTVRFVCSSIRLAEYFHKYIKQPKTDIHIPEFILQGLPDIRCAYLAGLADSDGAINNRPPHLVTTVYRSLYEEAGAVLSSLGIAGRTTITIPTEKTWSPKFNLTIPAFKSLYNLLIAPHSLKGAIKEGQKMNGFTIPGCMMREVYSHSEMRSMRFNGSPKIDSNYETYVKESHSRIDIPVTFNRLTSVDVVETYDIEVEDAHCFYCNGYLTHNSAGMKQGSPEDVTFTTSKDNLYVQDEAGKWIVDPKRSTLTTANHTIVYHHKPTLEEITAAVTKQFYFGEGAIQYAPEAIARANGDLLNTPEKKKHFLSVSEESKRGWNLGRKGYLRALYFNTYGVEISEDELDHRMQRYALNPLILAA